MSKVIIVTVAAALAALFACSSGVGEGNECGGSQDDCGTKLTCQPIAGTGHSYCCPTPPESSKQDVCHPKTQIDGHPAQL